MVLFENRSVGLIEDDAIMGESLSHSLSLEGFDVQWWQTGEEAIEALSTEPLPDALICDVRLPDMSGEDVFHKVGENIANLPVLFMTAYGDIDDAVRLMRAGACDYVTKPFDMPQFLNRLGAVIPRELPSADSVLGASRALQDIDTFLQRIANQTAPILLTGETGVGKEVCARHLHTLSGAQSPFMAVNCAAIPDELLESEIFGHERGAFTGATKRHVGYAERAGSGVLFLDEIGELPPKLQAKLLRLIEERSFVRVGGESDVPFRARVITATNIDLSAAALDGRFREDLLYRLNTFCVEVPPLRDRPEDIPWLLDRFFTQFVTTGESSLRGISALAEDAATAHHWPGNARELRNRVERAVALATGDWIMPGDLFPPGPSAVSEAHATPNRPLAEIREAAERRAIESALRDTRGQIKDAADLLGISRTTLWEKMRRLKLDS